MTMDTKLMCKDMLALSPADMQKKLIEDVTCCGFFDWFCKESSLRGRATRLAAAVRSFLKKNMLFSIPDDAYVFFKNNLPYTGNLYDSFAISSADGGVIVWVAPRNKDGVAELAYKGHGFKMGEKSFSFSSYRELCKFVNDQSKFTPGKSMFGSSTLMNAA